MSIVHSNSINSQSDFASYIKENSISGRNLSIRGLAGLCDVSAQSIIEASHFKSEKLAEKLAQSGFEDAHLLKHGFCAQSAWLVIEYFAYESKAKAEGAKRLARLFGSIGLKACFDAAHTPKITPTELSRLEILQMALDSETKAIALAAQIEANSERTALGAAIEVSEEHIRIGEMAKQLGIGQNKYFDELRDCGIIMAAGRLPYQQYMKYFKVTQVQQNGKWYQVALVNGKGQAYLAKRHHQWIESQAVNDIAEMQLPSIV